MKTLIADGESVRQIPELLPYIEPKVLMDVLQMDIRTCGLLENAALARRAGPYVVPDRPGLSIRVDEEVYRQKCRASEVAVS